MRIDAHHHLWRYVPSEFEWIDESMADLRRDFLRSDLRRVTAAAGIEGTVVVQARQSVEETDWLLFEASQTPLIQGVVGWLPLAAPDFLRRLETYADKTMLKGLRHVVQAEPPGFLDDPGFNAGVAALGGTGLVYDILIVESQLAEVIRFVDRHPEQLFVLDHFGKPRVGAGSSDVWSSAMRELAKREHVHMKVSGLVTEAAGLEWTPELLYPFWETALEAFTPARLMFGSDWPVLTAACSYVAWYDLVQEWLQPLSATEREAICGGVAARVYRL